jgi:hypothetical protein
MWNALMIAHAINIKVSHVDVALRLSLRKKDLLLRRNINGLYLWLRVSALVVWGTRDRCSLRFFDCKFNLCLFQYLTTVLNKVFVFSNVEWVTILRKLTSRQVVWWVLSLLRIGNWVLVAWVLGADVWHLLSIGHLQFLYFMLVKWQTVWGLPCGFVVLRRPHKLLLLKRT